MPPEDPIAQEAARLETLRSYKILDTPPEDAFDRITRLVAKLLKAPIALVSLVDEHRLWFKARVGLPVPELPRDQSFCDYAIRGSETLVVPDTLKHAYFAGNPLVVGEPHIRFYAGTPLRARGGQNIGTLCAIDVVPRELGDAELQALHDLAAVVEDALELRLAAETQRRLMEGKFDALFEYSPDSNVLVDEAGTITRVNHQTEMLFGYSRGELVGRPVEQLVPESLQVRHAADRRRMFAMAVPHVMGAGRGALFGRKRDGSAFPVEISLSRLQFEEGPQVLAAVRDITLRVKSEQERQGLEVQLRQAQKMEAIGRLAGGVAHDFNNMLQVIEGYTLLALDNLADPDQVAACLEQVKEAADRASDLTRRLLVFSRRQVLDRSTFSVGRLVLDLVKLASRLIGEDIELNVNVAAPDPVVHADAGMLEQVLVNLCVNARDAMPNGGKLAIEVSQIQADAEFCGRHGWARPGPYAAIALTDTGLGMNAEVRQRIFEPFFTTKAVGQGTGLGLPMAYGILQQHEGGIEVESAPGHGSVFRVYLPVTRGQDKVVARKVLAEASLGRELVLVAEDSPPVRDFVSKVLRDHGYRVLVAQDGEEAVALHLAQRGKIRLALVDMVMPRCDGRSAVEQLHHNEPDLPVLFTTGYAGNLDHEDFARTQGIPILRKPYAPAELLHAVRQALD
jgi:PAS domain S-box-containing protein